jgi:hypothetical protein
MMEIPKYEEILILGKRACTYLTFIVRFRTGHKIFDCNCMQSTGTGCMKDGICPLHNRMIKRLNIVSSHPRLLKDLEKLEIEEYKASDCSKCPNKMCHRSADDIKDCKIEDMIRRADEAEEKEKLQKLQKLQDETANLEESLRLQRQADADESDACIKYYEEMRTLGDPAYQDTTESDRETIAAGLERERKQKDEEDSAAYEKYCDDQKKAGNPLYQD